MIAMHADVQKPMHPVDRHPVLPAAPLGYRGLTALASSQDLIPQAVSETADHLGIPELAVREVMTVPWMDLVSRAELSQPVEITSEVQGREARQHPECPLSPPSPPTPPVSRRYPLHSAAVMMKVSDFGQSYLSYLVKVPSKSVTPTESEADIRRHPSFARYTRWLEQGSEPPYLTLFENERIGTPHRYTTTNRRRCLVARDLGRPITGWLSPICPDTGLPLKLNDVLRLYARAHRDLRGRPAQHGDGHMRDDTRDRTHCSGA